MDSLNKLFSLEDKTAVVTGAAGILGKEFCNALCSYGAKVICLDLHNDPLSEMTHELNETYGENSAHCFTCDVSNPMSVASTVDSIINQHHNVDILLNNAATKTQSLTAFFTPFQDYDLKTWNEVMAVNLDGMFLMAQAIGKHMVEAKTGTIIQTASIYSLLGPDQRIYEGSSYLNKEINTPAVYTASKAGVIGLTKHLATLWGRENVRINALCPGGVFSGQNTTFQEQYTNRIPMGRMASIEDIVGPMLFLASPASKYMTGQVLFADGGLSAW
ncbi:MAG: SDR family oxidoreductase [Gammaproteobacteria bacterium]|nr:SDR family oxidoreductase [Gammaproteobacteria bacterium]MCH9763346.1 SDR family oxidoreductase [Gammaproteobacteria bacterium]